MTLRTTRRAFCAATCAHPSKGINTQVRTHARIVYVRCGHCGAVWSIVDWRYPALSTSSRWRALDGSIDVSEEAE